MLFFCWTKPNLGHFQPLEFMIICWAFKCPDQRNVDNKFACCDIEENYFGLAVMDNLCASVVLIPSKGIIIYFLRGSDKWCGLRVNRVWMSGNSYPSPTPDNEFSPGDVLDSFLPQAATAAERLLGNVVKLEKTGKHVQPERFICVTVQFD